MAVNIHELWLLTSTLDKDTGETLKHGLVNIIGLDGAVRELKKRCAAEVDIADRPLAACAMYQQIILGWLELQMQRPDKQSRDLGRIHLEAVGEKSAANAIDELWEEYPDVKELPIDRIYDVMDDYREELIGRYGDNVPQTPDLLTPQELKLSKEIALTLGLRGQNKQDRIDELRVKKKRKKTTTESTTGERATEKDQIQEMKDKMDEKIHAKSKK